MSAATAWPRRRDVTPPATWSAGQIALAGVAGLLLAAYGLGAHLPDLILNGPTVAGLVGVAVGVAGLAVVVVASRRALHGRRWPAKLAAAGLTLVLLQWFGLPLVTGALVSSARHGDVAPVATLGLAGARDVRFPASDGVPIAGWYVPGRSDAAVVVMHGSHGTREATAGHVRALARDGFTVLSVDARGHGESGGDPNAAGWTAVPDVAGAVAFLRQAGVDPERIGGLGLSMGGEVLLRAAAEDAGLAAVVADGAGASTLGDMRIVDPGALPTSVSWVAMRAAELLSGDREPTPLGEVVADISAPVLLIASSAKDERAIDEQYRRTIGAGAQLWHVADAGHTQAFDVHPREYTSRVGAFLRAQLDARDPSRRSAG